MQVMNVRVYVYHPILDDSTTITALVVWDALEGGGVVDKYYIVIQDDGSNNVFVSNQCTVIFTISVPAHNMCPYICIHVCKCTSGNVMCVWEKHFSPHSKSSCTLDMFHKV